MGIAISTGHRGFVLSLLFIALAPNISSARNLQLSTQVIAREVAVLKDDLHNDLTLVDDAETKEIMGISDLSDRSIKLWLLDRVGFVIAETEDPKDHLISGGPCQYQNSGIFPKFEKAMKKPATQQSLIGPSIPVMVMGNVGLRFYYMGKEKNLLVGYKFDSNRGSQTVAITSPRVGFLQVGKGLFGIAPNKQNLTSLVNTWFRLAALLHEARHSDGNGASLGFPHAVCTKGHYMGFLACDREANGPYAVGAEILKRAKVTCLAKKTCTAGEAEMLGAMANDSHSRIIDTPILDPRPEGVIAQGGPSGN